MKTRTLPLLALLACVPLAHAALPPDRVSYQGVLRDVGGNPLNGTYDMTFRFFTALTDGDEILVDTHTGGNAVSVTDGLFDTHLGGGVVSDGSGPAVFTSLTSAFLAHSTTYLQIEVNGEVLTPRIQMVSSPYALAAGYAETAGSVDGMTSGQFLRSDTSDQYTSGVLTLNTGTTFNVNGGFNVNSADIFLNADGPDEDMVLWFFDSSSPFGEWIFWNDSEDRFNVSDDLHVSGTVQIGGDLSDTHPVYSRFGDAEPLSTGMNNNGDVLVTDDLEVRSSLLVSGDVRMHQGGPDGDQYIYFYDNGSEFGEWLKWVDVSDGNNANDRFELSNDLYFYESSASDFFTKIEFRDQGWFFKDAEAEATDAFFEFRTDAGSITQMRIEDGNEAAIKGDGAFQSNGIDYAEAFKVSDQTLEAGDVVSLTIGQWQYCKRTEGSYDQHIVGVVSTKPAFICGLSFNQEEQADPQLCCERDEAERSGDHKKAYDLTLRMRDLANQQHRPIALCGRVPCKVDGQYGPIKGGDRLTSSPTPGHAMRQVQAGQSIGVALEDFNGAGAGKIMVMVSPGYHVGSGGANEQNPPQQINDLQARLARLEALLEQQLTSETSK